MLLIEMIELKGFTGMWLNDINYFKMELKSDTTIILGRNGCGKSRLMSMLNPLSVTKDDLYANGHKRLFFVFDKTRYELISAKGTKSIKNTLKNRDTDEIILDAVNPKVMNQYVAEHFNYSKELHELLTGELVLTKMRTPERKKWFSKLSDSDLAYAIKYYAKARECLRDATGTVKTIKQNINGLRPKVNDSKEERESTAKRIEVLQSDISLLDSALSKISYDNSVSEESLISLENSIVKESNNLIKLELHMPSEISGINAVATKETIARLGAEYDFNLKLMDDINQRISRADNVKNVDTDALRVQITELETYIDLDSAKCNVFSELLSFDLTTITHSIDGYSEYGDIIIDCLNALNTDLDTKNIRGKYNELLEVNRKLSNEVTSLTNEDIKVTTYLKEVAHVHDVTCGNCNHRFKPGITEKDIDDKKRYGESIINKLTEIRNELEESNNIIERYAKLLHVYENTNMVMKHHGTNPATNILFKYLISEQAFTFNTSKYALLVPQFLDELTLAQMVKSRTVKVTELKRQLELAEATQAEDLSMLQLKRSEIEQSITNILTGIQYHQGLLKALYTYNANIDRSMLQENTLNELFTSYSNMMGQSIINIKIEEMREHRNLLWDLLVTAKDRYDNMERERTKLNNLEDMLSSTQVKVDNLNAIVKALSPEEGLLAKYLYKCISRVTDLMTNCVGRIWGYEMKVLPCDIEDGDLDYKFPFWTRDESKRNSDVSHGSKGQREVIDFVFALSAYKALKLNQYPLFMDELSSAFDEGHKDHLIDFIKELIAGGQHSQVIMVSHDAASYGKLVNADYVVIDPEGITCTQEYNKYVTIK